MKIIKAEAISIDIPIKAPLRVSGGVNLDFSRDIIVKITDEKGNTGYGEGAPRIRITGETRKECLAFLNNELFPNLKGEEISIGNISSILDEFPGHHAAKAPVDMAVYDIMSRSMGVPIIPVPWRCCQDGTACRKVGFAEHTRSHAEGSSGYYFRRGHPDNQ